MGQCRVSRVTTTVYPKVRIFLRLNRFSSSQVLSCEDFARTIRKEGIMVFSNPINIATATMEQIYERLCWIYSA